MFFFADRHKLAEKNLEKKIFQGGLIESNVDFKFYV